MVMTSTRRRAQKFDTLAYNADIVLGGSVTFRMAALGTAATYTQAFDTNHRDTLDALAVQINAGESTFAVKRVDDDLVVTARSATALGAVTTGGTTNGSTNLTHTKTDTAAYSGTETSDLTIVVDQYQDNTTNFTRAELVANVQSKVDAVTYIGDDSVAHTGLPLTVGYDLTTRSLTFTPKTDVYDGIYGSVKASSPSTVSAFGLDSATATFSAVGDAFMGGQIVPTGPSFS